MNTETEEVFYDETNVEMNTPTATIYCPFAPFKSDSWIPCIGSRCAAWAFNRCGLVEAQKYVDPAMPAGFVEASEILESVLQETNDAEDDANPIGLD